MMPREQLLSQLDDMTVKILLFESSLLEILLSESLLTRLNANHFEIVT